MNVNSDILLEMLKAEGVDIDPDLWDYAVESAHKWVEELLKNVNR